MQQRNAMQGGQRRMMLGVQECSSSPMSRTAGRCGPTASIWPFHARSWLPRPLGVFQLFQHNGLLVLHCLHPVLGVYERQDAGGAGRGPILHRGYPTEYPCYALRRLMLRDPQSVCQAAGRLCRQLLRTTGNSPLQHTTMICNNMPQIACHMQLARQTQLLASKHRSGSMEQ